jgi:CRP/FNR family cyclic AMP-dependent transcriptional regulator
MDKMTVLIVTPSVERRRVFELAIKRHIPEAAIFFADDGVDATAKADNAPPHVVLMEFELNKVSGAQLANHFVSSKKFESTAVLIASDPPAKEIFLEALVDGQVQFIGPTLSNESEVSTNVVKALNFSTHGKLAEFYLRYLAKGQTLLKEGEKADNVFIVRKGELRAFRSVNGSEVHLGQIQKGEFVGEMAYISGESRAANVVAVSDCELVEIPVGTLDKLLYQRPAWAKTLLKTLTKRLKQANTRAAATEKV